MARDLPTKEQIAAIGDVGALTLLHDDLVEDIRKIEVDLEFRSDGDLDWERRARGALTAHRICLGNVSQRIRQIQRKAGLVSVTEAAQDAKRQEKAARREAALEMQAQATARKEAAARASEAQAAAQRDAHRTKRHERQVSAIEALAWSRHFYKAARDTLSPELLQQIRSLADERHESAVDAAMRETASEFGAIPSKEPNHDQR